MGQVPHTMKADESEAMYSRKVFVGGLPFDITEEDLLDAFRNVIGHCNVLFDWPSRTEGVNGRIKPLPGYVFVIFDDEDIVARLVEGCHSEGGSHYMLVSSKTTHDKPVQVRPWLLTDAHYISTPQGPSDYRKTVFIGGMPRPTRASDLAEVAESHYGRVVAVSIDVDPELNYPKGAARVTFATTKSYVASITGHYLKIPHGEGAKRVEIKPYVVEEQPCDNCGQESKTGNYAAYFCADPSCLQYLCVTCWDHIHFSSKMVKQRTGHHPYTAGQSGLQGKRALPCSNQKLSGYLGPHYMNGMAPTQEQRSCR